VNLLACAESPDAPGKPVPTKRAWIKAFGLKEATGYQLLEKMKLKRSSLRNDGPSVLWSAVEKRKGFSKVYCNFEGNCMNPFETSTRDPIAYCK
jgi:hypothetical protein